MKLFDNAFFAAVSVVLFMVVALYALPIVLQGTLGGTDFALGIDAN